MNRALRAALLMAAVIAGIVLPEAAQAYERAADLHTGGSVTPEVLLAYVDPGAAGFIIVSVLGFLGAIGYTARAYLNRVKQLVFRGDGRHTRARTRRSNRTRRTRRGR